MLCSCILFESTMGDRWWVLIGMLVLIRGSKGCEEGGVNGYKLIYRGNMRLVNRGLLLPLAGAVSRLHFSPTVRALIHCIPMTIWPYPCHWYQIVVVITNGSLKFRHIIIPNANLNCNLQEFISYVQIGTSSSPSLPSSSSSLSPFDHERPLPSVDPDISYGSRGG